MNRPGFMRKWIIAVRPWAYGASVMPVLLGTALAHFQGIQLNWNWFALTLAGVVSFHTAGNLINDVYDFRRGLDKEPNSASGAIIRGYLSSSQVLHGAIFCLAIGVSCGIYLAAERGLPVLILCFAGAILAVAYTAPGLKLKHIGLGDLAIFLAFGVLAVLGTFWVQTGKFSWLAIWWSVPLAFLTVGILHANNWRDIDNDTNRNCFTFAAILGPEKSAHYYRFLVLGPFGIVLLYNFLDVTLPLWPTASSCTVLTFLSLPQVIRLVRISLKKSPNDRSNFLRLDTETAKAQVLFGMLLAISFLLAGFRLW